LGGEHSVRRAIVRRSVIRRRNTVIRVAVCCRRSCGRGAVPIGASRRAAGDPGVNGRPMMSTKTEAGPSAPARSPSSTRTSKVSRSPSRCGSLELDNCVADRSTVFAQDRYSGVRRVLGKTADGPFLVLGQQMTCSSGRPVGESNGVRADAGQGQSLALQTGAARVHDDQRRHHLDLDCRFARWRCAGRICRGGRLGV
jgi:hypothetical protein